MIDNYATIEVCHLVVNGRKFHSTWGKMGKVAALQFITNFRKRGERLTIRNYGVNIKTVNPKTNKVITWNKTDGYSLWRPL